MAGFPQGVRPDAPELGLQRVRWVRITMSPSGPRCQVAGMAHRRPVVRSVPLRTATALLAAGVPGWVDGARSGAVAAATGTDG
ncbi:MAG: hypothetical protein ACRD0S_04415 [Acidimicrobiales bacterium]